MNTDELYFENEPEVASHASRMESVEVRHQLALQMLKKVRDNISHVITLLEQGDAARATRQLVEMVSDAHQSEEQFSTKMGGRILEGVFDGQGMIGEDGTRYDVPHNYSSKSRLVQGDMLKLTIQPDGRHVYKQIGPVERLRIVGKLLQDMDLQLPVVQTSDRVYKVLTASITYHKGIPGDEVVILVPKDGDSEWAAVETIVNR